MKYRLIETPEDDFVSQYIDKVLLHRGVKYEELSSWKECGDDILLEESWENLDHIEDAVNLLKNTFDNFCNICVIVDSDADGITSAAIFDNFIFSLPYFEENKYNIVYIFHDGKKHGLSDCYDNILKVCGIGDLVVVPDAGSNDFEQLNMLCQKGISVLVLDHHHADNDYTNDSPKAKIIVVNNQLSENFQNKYLSGAGIVLKFCKAFNEIVGTNGYLSYDLAALGNLSDMMPYWCLDTRRLISYGLAHIENPFIKEMMDYNSLFIDKKGVNYMSMAFYVTPYINACMRIGTLDEKELLFKAMTNRFSEEIVESHKRGANGEKTLLVKEAVRVMSNIKNTRQRKIQEEMIKKIEDSTDLIGPVIIARFSADEYDSGILGVVANKLQSTYQKPSFVLLDDGETSIGSARNYSKSSIKDLRLFCENSEYVNFAQGHSSAFGISIDDDKIKDFIEYASDNIEHKDYEYFVDFAWEYNFVPPNAIFNIGNAGDYWGQQVEEPLVCVKNIPVTKNNSKYFDTKKGLVKINLQNGVTIVKFDITEDEYNDMLLTKNIDIVGKCNINIYNGDHIPQIIVEDYSPKISEDYLF